MASSEIPSAAAGEFHLGVGDALGFGGNVSPAKLALAHGLSEGPDAADRAVGADGR